MIFLKHLVPERKNFSLFRATHGSELIQLSTQKLHALGVIIFRWNLSENKLFVLFADLLRCPIEEAHVLAHELGDVALMIESKYLPTEE